MKFLHIIRRKHAKEAGLIKYFSPQRCPQNHDSERYVKGGSCVQCMCERQIEKWKAIMLEKHGTPEERAARSAQRKIEKKRRQKEGWREYWTKYYAENKEKRKAANKIYRQNNKELYREIARRNYLKNKEKCHERSKNWKKNNPECEKAYINNRRARIANAGGSFTSNELADLFDKQKGICALCGFEKLKKKGKGKYHADHIQPLSKGGTNWITNIQLTCPTCNLKKSDKDPFDFANENGKLL